MVIGFSGSRAGLSEVYRVLTKADVISWIDKYESILKESSPKMKPFYSLIVKDLKELDSRLKEQKLEEVIRES